MPPEPGPIVLSLPAIRGGDESTLAEQVYESLLEAILNGTLPPGEVVSVVKLADEFGVSRTPVHEAVRELVSDGLVIQETNRRPVIASFSSRDIRDIYGMRLLLESEAAARAASRIDRPTVDRVQADLEDLAAAPRDAGWLRVWADHDADLHECIASACDSPRLAEDIRRYRRLHHGINSIYTDADVLGQAIEEHREILRALAARDSRAARKAMTAHLREWQAYFSGKVGES